jgi:hypothetical protein
MARRNLWRYPDEDAVAANFRLTGDQGYPSGRGHAHPCSRSWGSEGGVLPDADEIAATVWRTLQLPDIAALRGRLTPEWPVYALLGHRPGQPALAGRIDAIAYVEAGAGVVIDWKSDVDPSEADMRLHAGQPEVYLRATGAPRGVLVYMTPGLVRWVALRPAG